jgi:hypothetical protein
VAACGRTEVVVQGQLEGAEGQPIALRDLPFRMLPYDRDAIFDSLRAAYREPEPEIPADLMMLQDSIAQAQEQWRRRRRAVEHGARQPAALRQRMHG